MKEWGNIELIAIPVFLEARLPDDKENPWFLGQNSPQQGQAVIHDADTPEVSVKNTELAAKFSGFYSGLDIAFSAFYTWDDFPVYHKEASFHKNRPLLCITPKHHRMTVYGMEVSRPWSDYVFRGEAAYYHGRYREAEGLTDPLKKDSLKWLLGLDWTPGDDWTVAVQLMDETIFSYDTQMIAKEHTSMSTFHISKKFLNQTLTVSNMTFIGLNEQDYYNRFKLEYDIMDGLRASVGLDLFSGKNKGQFGRYEDNNQLWCKIRYSF